MEVKSSTHVLLASYCTVFSLFCCWSQGLLLCNPGWPLTSNSYFFPLQLPWGLPDSLIVKVSWWLSHWFLSLKNDRMLGDPGVALELPSVSSAVHQLSWHGRALGRLPEPPRSPLNWIYVLMRCAFKSERYHIKTIVFKPQACCKPFC